MHLPKITLKRRGPSKDDIAQLWRLKKTKDKLDSDLKDKHQHITVDALRFKNILLCIFSLLLASNKDDNTNALEFYRIFRHLYEGGSLNDLPLNVDKDKFFKKVEQIITGSTLVLDD